MSIDLAQTYLAKGFPVTVSRKTRSEMMASVKGKNTKPEVAVRSFLHRLGFRFSLHRKDLPGRPDICLPKYRTVIFVHGCFWHRHEHCKRATTPTSNAAFWRKKFIANIARDKRNITQLKKAGWRPLLVWECQLQNPVRLASFLKKHLKQKLTKKPSRL